MQICDSGILLPLLDSEQFFPKHLFLELSEISWVSFRQSGSPNGSVDPWKSARIAGALRRENVMCSSHIYKEYRIQRSENLSILVIPKIPIAYG